METGSTLQRPATPTDADFFKPPPTPVLLLALVALGIVITLTEGGTVRLIAEVAVVSSCAWGLAQVGRWLGRICGWAGSEFLAGYREAKRNL